MNLKLIIDILTITLPSLFSCIAIFISIKTLKQTHKFQLLNQKATIILSIDRTRTDFIFSKSKLVRVVIKNYGNSSGIIKSISTNPDINDIFEEFKTLNNDRFSSNNLELFERALFIFKIKNVHLAPNQTILTYLPLGLFSKNNDINIRINYSSLGYSFCFNETINLEYRNSLSVTSPKFSDENEMNNDTSKVLRFIGESIREVSDRL